MTIYYNPAYSASPYRSSRDVEYGNSYCGNFQLLQRLLFYLGVPYLPATDEERVAYYHANMQRVITADSLFYHSFVTDSAGASRKILAWRDTLVTVGWNIKEYKGGSAKLAMFRDLEPESMPRGEADYWYLLLSKSRAGEALSKGVNIVVTASQSELCPHIAKILELQQQNGVMVEYRPMERPVAEGTLGLVQRAIYDEATAKISPLSEDDTLEYINFDTEDDALAYVALLPVDDDVVFHCTMPKRFDNTLKMLGKPTVGSMLDAGSPQVVQLFMLGNGLFEYPLNMKRIIEWLNTPLNPMDNALRRELSYALISSGGIDNKEWNDVKSKFLSRKDDVASHYDKYLPLPVDGKIDVERVKAFNDELRKWASSCIHSMKSNSDIILEQLMAINNYCSTLITMLEQAPESFDFLDLQLWCRNIAQPASYKQYEAEVGCHNIITSMGDIHDIAERVVWFPACDARSYAYPFDMLNDSEYAELKNDGVLLYKRDHHAFMQQSEMLRMLLNTKRLTIIEAEKSNGEKTQRHPLVLQLEERIKGGFKNITKRVSIPEEFFVMEQQVDNREGDAMMVQLDEDVVLKERYECATDKDSGAESYSSLEQLIQHPFTYVCQRKAKLKDREMPSAQDCNRTLGNVAHLIIEKVFADGRDVNEATAYYKANYDAIFEEAVRETGLLLLSKENALSLRKLKRDMLEALRKLTKFIRRNNLSVVSCEYVFNDVPWNDAGEGVMLDSRIDMLLNDSSGGKVIFDFKYSSSSRRRCEIEENRALQLALYRYLVQQQFGKDTRVRIAYILLPDVDILTADDFDEARPISVKPDRSGIDIMAEAARSYIFRWKQLKEGRIERVEDCVKGSGEYGVESGLFPLKTYGKTYETDSFNPDYSKLK